MRKRETCGCFAFSQSVHFLLYLFALDYYIASGTSISEMVVLSNLTPPTEGVRHCEPKTEVFINDKCLGVGSLYIAESRVSWTSDGGDGFSLEYPAICLHAVSRDVSLFPHECLYLMVEGDLAEPRENGTSSDNEDSGDETSTDVKFVPENKAMLDQMFSAMSDCQVLHPDEDQSDDSDDYCGDEGEGDALTPQGVATLEHLETIFDDGTTQPRAGAAGDSVNGNDEPMETGQFDDADDVDH